MFPQPAPIKEFVYSVSSGLTAIPVLYMLSKAILPQEILIDACFALLLILYCLIGAVSLSIWLYKIRPQPLPVPEPTLAEKLSQA